MKLSNLKSPAKESAFAFASQVQDSQSRAILAPIVRCVKTIATALKAGRRRITASTEWCAGICRLQRGSDEQFSESDWSDLAVDHGRAPVGPLELP